MFDLTHGWNQILVYLENRGKITREEKRMFLDFFLGVTEKNILETYRVSKQALREKVSQLLSLVLATNETILADALKYQAFLEKTKKLKFRTLSMETYSDKLMSVLNMRDVRFLDGLKIKTFNDLLFVELKTKKTKSAQKENERLLAVVQKVVTHLGI